MFPMFLLFLCQSRCAVVELHRSMLMMKLSFSDTMASHFQFKATITAIVMTPTAIVHHHS